MDHDWIYCSVTVSLLCLFVYVCSCGHLFLLSKSHFSIVPLIIPSTPSSITICHTTALVLHYNYLPDHELISQSSLWLALCLCFLVLLISPGSSLTHQPLNSGGLLSWLTCAPNGPLSPLINFYPIFCALCLHLSCPRNFFTLKWLVPPK